MPLMMVGGNAADVVLSGNAADNGDVTCDNIFRLHDGNVACLAAMPLIDVQCTMPPAPHGPQSQVKPRAMQHPLLFFLPPSGVANSDSSSSDAVRLTHFFFFRSSTQPSSMSASISSSLHWTTLFLRAVLSGTYTHSSSMPALSL